MDEKDTSSIRSASIGTALLCFSVRMMSGYWPGSGAFLSCELQSRDVCFDGRPELPQRVRVRCLLRSSSVHVAAKISCCFPFTASSLPSNKQQDTAKKCEPQHERDMNATGSSKGNGRRGGRGTETASEEDAPFLFRSSPLLLRSRRVHVAAKVSCRFFAAASSLPPK